MPSKNRSNKNLTLPKTEKSKKQMCVLNIKVKCPPIIALTDTLINAQYTRTLHIYDIC